MESLPITSAGFLRRPERWWGGTNRFLSAVLSLSKDGWCPVYGLSIVRCYPNLAAVLRQAQDTAATGTSIPVLSGLRSRFVPCPRRRPTTTAHLPRWIPVFIGMTVIDSG